MTNVKCRITNGAAVGLAEGFGKISRLMKAVGSRRWVWRVFLQMDADGCSRRWAQRKFSQMSADGVLAEEVLADEAQMGISQISADKCSH